MRICGAWLSENRSTRQNRRQNTELHLPEVSPYRRMCASTHGLKLIDDLVCISVSHIDINVILRMFQAVKDTNISKSVRT